MSKPLDRLKHHVTGAIERGEKQAILAVTSPKRFAVFVTGGHHYTLEAANLAEAFAKAKAACNADTWDMSPVWHGEAYVENTFRFERKRYTLRVVAEKYV